jgi:hypothetical protein
MPGLAWQITFRGFFYSVEVGTYTFKAKIGFSRIFTTMQLFITSANRSAAIFVLKSCKDIVNILLKKTLHDNDNQENNGLSRHNATTHKSHTSGP